MLYHKKNESGFALFLALTVVAVVVSVMLTLIDLTVKQVRLSTSTKDSEIAFRVAAAGGECLQYHRYSSSTRYEAGQTVPVNCFGLSADADTVVTDSNFAPSTVYYYGYQIDDWSIGGSNRCVQMGMLTINSNPGDIVSPINTVHTYIPTAPQASVNCPSGGRCTILSVKGYSVPCGNIGQLGALEREVFIEL